MRTRSDVLPASRTSAESGKLARSHPEPASPPVTCRSIQRPTKPLFPVISSLGTCRFAHAGTDKVVKMRGRQYARDREFADHREMSNYDRSPLTSTDGSSPRIEAACRWLERERSRYALD